MGMSRLVEYEGHRPNVDAMSVSVCIQPLQEVYMLNLSKLSSHENIYGLEIFI